MNQIGTALVGSNDFRLVALSILISILASHVVLDLAACVTAACGGARRACLTGGSISMGLGIWSMHFTGMLAYDFPVPWVTTGRDSRLGRRTACSHSAEDGPHSTADRPMCTTRTVWRRAP